MSAESVRARLDAAPGFDMSARDRFPVLVDVLASTQRVGRTVPTWPKWQTVAEQRRLVALAITTAFDTWDERRRDRAYLRLALDVIEAAKMLERACFDAASDEYLTPQIVGGAVRFNAALDAFEAAP